MPTDNLDNKDKRIGWQFYLIGQIEFKVFPDITVWNYLVEGDEVERDQDETESGA